MAIDILTFSQHLQQYMPGTPFNISTGGSPIKVAALEETQRYLQCPTALFKPEYNMIIHITKGTIKAQVGFNKIIAEQQSVLLLFSNKIIAREFLSDDLEGFAIIIENYAFSKLLSKSQLLKIFEVNANILLSADDSNTIAGLNSLLVEESKSKNPNNDFIHAMVQGLLFKLLGQSELASTISRSEEIDFSFKQLVYQHFQQQHTIAFYAKGINISESYLNRCVKCVFQQSAKEIWTEIIIQYSQVLLQDATKEIAEIAYLLNFTNPSYFGRLFKKTTGGTPTLYRKQQMDD